MSVSSAGRYLRQPLLGCTLALTTLFNCATAADTPAPDAPATATGAATQPAPAPQAADSAGKSPAPAKEPVKEPAAKETPKAPAKEPAKEATPKPAAKEAASKDAPAKDAQAKDAAAKDAQVKDAAGKDAAAKAPATNDAAAKDAPKNHAHAKDAAGKDAAQDAKASTAPKPDAAPAPQPFSFADVQKQARELAAQGYKPPVSNLPDELQDLKYAGYQNVRLRDDHLHWRDAGTPFRLGFYHQGMHFNTPVRINEIDDKGAVTEIPFDASEFDYGQLAVNPDLLKGLGFAGFKLLYPVNTPLKPNDELASFLGASYFRVIGRGQAYGLSARGLAIDTALPSGEEFPAFRKFWIERPKGGNHQIVLYALLDSPRATGAYRFIIRPEVDTVVDVKAQIYLRDKVGRLGLAPLTSMFLYGANQAPATPNYRPEMHDSDGLAIQTGSGEWVWRPLNNPRRLAVSAFSADSPRGFGLLQRTREFSRYEDLDDHYEKRPSLWIEPVGDWGKGSVQLVEIPTPDETNDNIVAFWVPASQPAAGKPLDIEYRMVWTLDEPRLHDTSLAWVKQTRRSREEVKGPDLIRRGDGSQALVVDFVGPALKDVPADTTITAEVSVDGNGQIVENTVRPNPVTGGRRMMLRVNVKDPAKPVELRAFLTNGQTALSETWTYQLPVNAPETK
ncbi:glucan biosynthesis protein G [Bordetella genomosp. 13]|uniref:glucan biosynthesis protein G n=1 Tax=Bordetella genomosp. 13 TaxID=463040 RepID=UPI0028D4DCBD|nr:glucan biosynthesis protein [Bordetella genomosp. 13]